MESVAIITGASAGMGRQFALQLKGKYGIEKFWLVARNRVRLEKLSEELGGNCRIFVCDLSREEGLESVAHALCEEKPDVKVLVNGAGYGIMQSVENTPYDQLTGMIDLNARTLFALTYKTLPFMRSGAKIVNIGSFSSFEPLPYMSIYAATKAFVLSFTRSLNTELKNRGIHAICLCPMWVKTEFFDRANKDKLINNYPHPYEPDWVVKKCVKALGGKKDYIVPGLYAKFNHFLTKILPHSLVMKTFLKQQGIKL